MTGLRTHRVAAAALTMVAAAALAGCHNADSSTQALRNSTPSGSPGVVQTATGTEAVGSSAAFPAHDRLEIKQDWERFFNGGTPIGARIELLQNGQSFQRYLAKHQHDKKVQQLGSKVTNVKIGNAGKATVTFDLYENGKPVAKNLSGDTFASRQLWLVSDSTFCSVVTKYGQPKPDVCP